MEEEREQQQLYQQLNTLSPLNKSQTQLQEIIETLWTTRKTGLSPAQKSHFRSLLNLPSLAQLNPVLACLRSLIRKCAQENFPVNDISKLFPPDLPLDLQRSLVVIFQTCQNQWKEDISVSQTQSPRTKFPLHTKAGMPQPLTCFPTSAASSPRPLELLTAHNSCNDIGASIPITTDINLSPLASMPPERGVGTDNLGTPPQLKSMTWTLDNQSKTRRNKVAVISLKLQDCTKSPLGETTEVNFQLTRDTVDAMLKSMTQINEKFSTYVGTSSGTMSKK